MQIKIGPNHKPCWRQYKHPKTLIALTNYLANYIFYYSAPPPFHFPLPCSLAPLLPALLPTRLPLFEATRGRGCIQNKKTYLFFWTSVKCRRRSEEAMEGGKERGEKVWMGKRVAVSRWISESNGLEVWEPDTNTHPHTSWSCHQVYCCGQIKMTRCWI